MADTRTRPATRPGPVRVIVTAAMILTCATLPMFLLGALAPRIIADLGVDEVAIGTLVAVFFLAGAATSLPGGRVTDRIGATAALRTSALLAAVIAAAIAGFGRELWILVVLFVLAGTAVPLADTGGARAIAAGVPVGRQGLAFGGKEASIPVAALIAGLTIPVLGAQFGWRPAYVVAAALAAVAVFAIPRRLDREVAAPPAAIGGEEATLPTTPAAPPTPDRAATTRALVLLAVAAGLGSAAANSAPTFLVASAVASGVAEATAGTILAVASTAGVASRLAAGVAADRRGGSERRLTAGLMAVGGAGMVALAVGGTVLAPLGAVLALGGGWGWTGLAFFAAVRLTPDRPARAAGAILAGLASGGALGPLAFGALAAGPGYTAAWSASAVALLAAGTLALIADRSVTR